MVICMSMWRDELNLLSSETQNFNVKTNEELKNILKNITKENPPICVGS